MQLQRCDSCGETSPATGPASAGAWIASDGADGCVKLALTLVRKAEPPDYAKPNVPEGDVYYSQATTTLDLCAKCGERVIAALGTARVKLPAEAGDPEMVVVPMNVLKEALGHGD